MLNRIFLKRGFIVLWGIALCFVSCQKSVSPSRPDLRLNIISDPQTLDPRKARDLNGLTLIRMAFEGLTRVGRDGKIENALAERIEVSEDQKTYTFHLRPSVWSDGKPLTAFDFVYAWTSLLSPSFPTDIAYQLFGIRNAKEAKQGKASLDEVGVRASGSSILTVELSQPIPYFLELISNSYFFPVPQHIVEKEPFWGTSAQNLVSNGPFQVNAWIHADQITLSKNPRYWEADQVRLEKLELVMVSSETEMRLYQQGELDWAGSPLSTLPTDGIAFFKQEKKLQVHPLSGTSFYRINTAPEVHGKKNPLTHPSFRKALALCMNRKAIAEQILQGGHLPACRLVPPEMDLFKGEYFKDQDILAAKELLQQALNSLGVSLEQLEPLVISYTMGDRNASIAQAIQNQWAKDLQVPVVLEALERKVFLQKCAQRTFQIAAGSWIGDFNDPINFLEVFKYKEASTNNTEWENANFIALLDRSALSKTDEERRALLQAAEQLLMEEMPMIPIHHYVLNYLKKEGLEGEVLSPIGQVDFRWAYWKGR